MALAQIWAKACKPVIGGRKQYKQRIGKREKRSKKIKMKRRKIKTL